MPLVICISSNTLCANKRSHFPLSLTIRTSLPIYRYERSLPPLRPRTRKALSNPGDPEDDEPELGGVIRGLHRQPFQAAHLPSRLFKSRIKRSASEFKTVFCSCQIFDKDLVGTDDFMGEAQVDLTEMNLKK